MTSTFVLRPSVRRLAVLLVAALLASASLSANARESRASFPGLNGQIVFVSSRDGNDEIYVMSPNGSNQEKMTNYAGEDRQPAFGPDGRLIALRRVDVTDFDIFRINADGTATNLTNNVGVQDLRPSFFPDGRIAFVSNRVGSQSTDIWVMDPFGNVLANLTNFPGPDANPAVSPDGTRIAFISSRGQGTDEDIWVMNADGSFPTALTADDDLADDLAPVWSPDGTRIAFASNRDGDFEIYTMKADGTDVTQVTHNTESDAGPSYSPDGTKLVFQSNRSGDLQVWVMSTGGGNPVKLTSDGENFQPDWGRDAAPTITITTPADGAVYQLGQAVYADYGCADLIGAALDSCAGPVPDGDAVATGSVGAHTFTVNAEDEAGHASSASHAYSVQYVFGGFYAPVDNPPVVNRAKAGSAIPIKFSLGGNQGLNIFATGYPASRSVTCGTNAVIDAIEETVTAGNSSLTYDAATGRYHYVWKTLKGWTGCRELILRLADGTDHVAYFEFK